MVALSELKLNSALVTYLRRCEHGRTRDTADDLGDTPNTQYRPWSIERRLSEGAIQTIISEFMAGTSKHALAAQYSVSLSGLKSLRRRRGIRRSP